MATEASSDAPLTDEQRFRLLVEAVTDYAIYMLDPHGTVTSWNAGAQRFKGYTPDEIIGQHFSRFYTEEDRQTNLPRRALETAAREGRFEQEGWRVRKDGTRFWAHVVIDPIRDEQGTLIGFAKITRDVSERKKAQEALEATRTALFQSQKMETVGRDRTRLQQPACGRDWQSRTPAQTSARGPEVQTPARQLHGRSPARGVV